MDKQNLRFAAEWEPQDAVQLTWPHAQTDWLPWLDEITDTCLQLARIILKHERLLVVTPEPDALRELLNSWLTEEEMGRVTLVACPTNDTWARDHAPLTLVDDEGGGLLLDFRFNGWGEKFAADKDNNINKVLDERGVLDLPMEDHEDLVLEGGSVETDGCGTVFTTTGCLLAPHRNQPLTQAEIEDELKRRLRAQRVVWIDHGHLEGDDTDGHIDTLVRVAPNDTLLYVQCTDMADEHYADLHAMEQQLQTLRTAMGEPYRLLPLPMTRPIVENGERLPATYANYLVVNNAVILPTYAQPDLDAQAARQLRLAFPGREIIPLDARCIIRQHGSVHCMTMQYPHHRIS